MCILYVATSASTDDSADSCDVYKSATIALSVIAVIAIVIIVLLVVYIVKRMPNNGLSYIAVLKNILYYSVYIWRINNLLCQSARQVFGQCDNVCSTRIHFFSFYIGTIFCAPFPHASTDVLKHTQDRRLRKSMNVDVTGDMTPECWWWSYVKVRYVITFYHFNRCWLHLNKIISHLSSLSQEK